MSQPIIRGFTVPQWLYGSIQIPYGKQNYLETGAFQNKSWFRMRLIGISFTSDYALDRSGTTVTTLPTVHPTWSSDLLIDIGKSGHSDQNLVRSTLTNLCGTPFHDRQKWGANNMGRSYFLRKPYILPRDEGLEVEVENRWPGYEDTGTIPPATFIAKGFTKSGYPAMLAGKTDKLKIPGGISTMSSVDLFNNGKEEMHIYEFCFKGMDTVIVGAQSAYGWKGDGTQLAYRVNPANPDATSFMPSAQCIPVGNLTPGHRCYDGGSESPLCYWFNQEHPVYLEPKQEITIHVGNQSANDEAVLNICLFGELEVE